MYQHFAKSYYNIMKNTTQNKYFNYYKNIFNKLNITPELILDLGCGTGSISIPLAQKGY